MFRNLTEAEITILKEQNCRAEDWSKVLVKDGFSTSSVSNTQFSGKIRLGIVTKDLEVEKGITKVPAIRYCHIDNCTIGDNVYMSNVHSIVNYDIADNTILENIGTIVVNGETTFGNGTEIEVLNEGGGRELPIFDNLTAQIAYLHVVYRHDSQFIEKLEKIINGYVNEKRASRGTIGENARILNTVAIRNVYISSYSVISGASKLEEGSIVSCKSDPAIVGEGVIAKKFIILSGSEVDSGAIITSTFIGQGVKIGKQFSAEGSAFFANCEGFHGEACSLFAGPYTVTHHKSSLLIAGMFSFYNAGSGTNQSNHMYKLGPIHQGIVERGSKTGSFSYMLWPCRVGAYSVVMDKHGANFDTSNLPFSYINVENGKSVVTPAMNLFTVGTVRDNQKWPNRDRRKDPDKLDLIHFDFFSPYIIQKIILGSKLLADLYEATPKTKEYVQYNGVHINRLMLRTSRRYYDLAVSVYMGDKVVERLEKSGSLNSMKEVRQVLKPEITSTDSTWLDLLGLIATDESILELMRAVKSEKISTIDELQEALKKIHDEYETKAYSWCAQQIEKRLDIKVSEITEDQFQGLIADWKSNSMKLRNMVLKDAEKEFDQHSKIGFGIDGDEQTRTEDFEAIRGTFDNNSFIQGLRQEIEDIKAKVFQYS